MLYLDSSALVKRYVQEAGSKAVTARFESGETIYTSVLTFAEVHAAIGRKFHDREMSVTEREKIVEDFQNDWIFSLSILELTIHTMSALPALCQQYPLNASDAIHLSTAYWLRYTIRLQGKRLDGENIVEFGVSDRQLGEAALKCRFKIFRPT
jgi:predicted nucleic acid-binding protein